MDLEYQQNQNIDDSRLSQLDNVVVVLDQTAAETYLSTVFPLYANTIVYTCKDRSYPQCARLRKHVEDMIAQHKGNYCVYNYDCFRHVADLQECNTVVMDEYIMCNYRRNTNYFKYATTASPEQCVTVMKMFFERDAIKSRANNFTDAYNRFEYWKPIAQDNWHRNLMIGGSNE